MEKTISLLIERIKELENNKPTKPIIKDPIA